MYFPDGTRVGAHNASGVTEAAQRWILAEGASGVFSTFILVANPNATTTNVRVQYLKSTGEVVVLHRCAAGQQPHHVLAAERLPRPARDRRNSRPSSKVSIRANRSSPSGRCTSIRHRRAAVSRAAAMTRSAFPRPAGNGISPKGFTGGNAQTAFETFLLLANTNASKTTATVTYQLDSGQAVTRDYELSPNQRLTVWVDQEGRTLRRPPEGRVVWHHRASHPADGGRTRHVLGHADCRGCDHPDRSRGAKAMPRPGSPVLASRWAFAEGREGEDASARPYSTFFLLSNPGAAPVNVQATFMTEDGGGLTTTVTIPAEAAPTSGRPPDCRRSAPWRIAALRRSSRARRRAVRRRARDVPVCRFQQRARQHGHAMDGHDRGAVATAGHGHRVGLHARPDAPQRR